MLLKVLSFFFVPLLFLGIIAGMVSRYMPVAVKFIAVFAIIIVILSCTIPVILMRQYAAYLEGRVESISQSFSSSILSTIFLAIVWLFFGIGCVILLMLLFLLHFSPVAIVLWIMLLLAYFLFVGVRIFFATQAIAVREKGPLEAMEYSWKLTEGKGYFRVLATALMITLVALLPSIFWQGIFYLVPLYMPVNFAAWPWALLISIALVFFFIYLAINFLTIVYPVAVFINTESQIYAKEWANAPDMKVVNKHAPSTVKAVDGEGEVKFNGEETVRLSAEEIQSLTVQSTPVAAEGEDENLQAHLDQVFQKAPEGIAQKGDEDRMPTILFDDEMAQQLEENRKMFDKKSDKNKDNDDNGPQSIKMSK